MSKPKYEVLTWDMELQMWTPQQGVRRGPYTLWGLKRALQKLRQCGYGCEYRSRHCDGDPSVSVTRIGYYDDMLREHNLAKAKANP